MSICVEYQLDLGPQGADARRLEPKDGPDWAGIPALVRQATDLGFDGIVAIEAANDPIMQLALAAQTPSDIQLISGIAVAFSRSPTALAYNAWELQRMSGGRLILGLGSQVRNQIVRRFAMPWSSPAERMRDFIGALRACWTCWQDGTPLDYQGKIYQIDFMPRPLTPPPLEHPYIPLQLAAVGDKMLHLAGELTDGVRLHDLNSRRYLDEVIFPNLKAGFERSGRPPEDWARFQVAGGAAIITGRTDAEVEQAFEARRGRIAYAGANKSYRGPFEIEGFGDVADQLHILSQQQRGSEMRALVSDDLIHRFAVVARHDQLAAALKAKLHGVNRIRLNLPMDTPEERETVKSIVADLHV